MEKLRYIGEPRYSGQIRLVPGELYLASYGPSGPDCLFRAIVFLSSGGFESLERYTTFEKMWQDWQLP